MATLSISVDLTQVREAHGAFQTLMDKFNEMAVDTVKKIHKAFNKQLDFTGFRKSEDAFLKIMGEFEEIVAITIKSIMDMFKKRPNLDEWRSSLRSFKTIMKEFKEEAKETAEVIKDSLAKGKNKLTPEVDLQKISDSRQRLYKIMDGFERIHERAINKMIKDWQRLGNQVATTVGQIKQMSIDINSSIMQMGAIQPVLTAIIGAMNQLATASQQIQRRLPRINVNQFQGNVLGGGNVNVGGQNAFNTRTSNVTNPPRVVNQLNQVGAAADLARDRLLAMHFLLQQFSLGNMLQQVKEFVSGLVEAQKVIDSTAGAMLVAFGSNKQVEIEMNRIRKVADEMGLDVKVATEEYGRLAAAAKDSGIQGRVVFELWKGVSQAATAVGGDFERAIKAIIDMVSKGKIEREDLIKQFSQAIPGGSRLATLAAEKLGKSMQDLTKGIVTPTQFLEKLGVVMGEVYGPVAAAAALKMQASINRLKNAWFDLQKATNQGTTGNSGFNSAWIFALQKITEFMKDPATVKAFREIGDALGVLIPKAIRILIPMLKLLRDNLGAVVTILGVLGGAITGALAGGKIGLILGGAAGVIPGMVGGAAAGGLTGLVGGGMFSSGLRSGGFSADRETAFSKSSSSLDQLVDLLGNRFTASLDSASKSTKTLAESWDEFIGRLARGLGILFSGAQQFFGGMGSRHEDRTKFEREASGPEASRYGERRLPREDS